MKTNNSRRLFKLEKNLCVKFERAVWQLVLNCVTEVTRCSQRQRRATPSVRHFGYAKMSKKRNTFRTFIVSCVLCLTQCLCACLCLECDLRLSWLKVI